jgi:hypothetical protein
MKTFSYKNGKTRNELDITNIQHDSSFKKEIIKTCSFRALAPASWSDTAISSALANKTPRDLLLHMFIELTDAHDKDGTSFLPKDCFLLAVAIKDKPCIMDSDTLPLLSNGTTALYICYADKTNIRIGDLCVTNNAGEPVVSDYVNKNRIDTQELTDFHVFDF